MHLSSLFGALCLITIASFASADDHIRFGDSNVWMAQQITFNEPSSQQRFLQGLDKFMDSKLGDRHPGTVSVNWLLANGENPATHGFLMSFPSLGARQEWSTEFFNGGSKAAGAWMQTWNAEVASVEATYMMTTIGAWGETSSSNPYTETVPFYTENMPAFVGRFQSWMETPTAAKFKGRVAIHSCIACGESGTNGLMTVTHNSGAEMDEWRNAFAGSEDGAAWLSSAVELADFPGNSLVYRLVSYE